MPARAVAYHLFAQETKAVLDMEARADGVQSIRAVTRDHPAHGCLFAVCVLDALVGLFHTKLELVKLVFRIEFRG